MARKREGITDVMEELLRRNGRVITGFACLLIITVGTTLVNNPSRWWLSGVAVLIFFAVVFLFLNARVFIKSTVAIMIVLLEAAGAFKIGAVSDYAGSGGSIWMLSILFGFFAILALSYVLPSSRSRWGVSTLTTTASFFFVYITAMSDVLPLRWAALLGTALNAAFFVLMYRYGRRNNFKAGSMPAVGLADGLGEDIINGVRDYGWGAVLTKHKDGVLVWNNDVAFLLTGLTLPQKFGVSTGGFRGRGATHLTYNGVNINPWLMEIVYRLVPYWKTRGADIMLVLLDERNGNGGEAKTIGVQLPDTRGRIPVGVLPARNFLDRGNYAGLLKRVEEEFGQYVRQLSFRQLHALDLRLPLDDTVMLSENSDVDK